MKKLWYLLCGETQEYAVVFAKSPKKAFKKLKKKRTIEADDFSKWEIERLKKDSYDGVLYFF